MGNAFSNTKKPAAAEALPAAEDKERTEAAAMAACDLSAAKATPDGEAAAPAAEGDAAAAPGAAASAASSVPVDALFHDDDSDSGSDQDIEDMVFSDDSDDERL